MHRLLVTSVMLAAKFFDDHYYNNAYYAKVGGVPYSEMNALEVEFLFMLNFDLFVTTETYKQYYDELWSHANSPHAHLCGCIHAKVPLLILPRFDDPLKPRAISPLPDPYDLEEMENPDTPDTSDTSSDTSSEVPETVNSCPLTESTAKIPLNRCEKYSNHKEKEKEKEKCTSGVLKTPNLALPWESPSNQSNKHDRVMNNSFNSVRTETIEQKHRLAPYSHNDNMGTQVDHSHVKRGNNKLNNNSQPKQSPSIMKGRDDVMLDIGDCTMSIPTSSPISTEEILDRETSMVTESPPMSIGFFGSFPTNSSSFESDPIIEVESKGSDLNPFHPQTSRKPIERPPSRGKPITERVLQRSGRRLSAAGKSSSSSSSRRFKENRLEMNETNLRSSSTDSQQLWQSIVLPVY